jgi:hypothetical protein
MLRISVLMALATMTMIAVSACEVGRPGSERPESSAKPVDFGPTAAYERRVVFLGPGQRLPTAVIMDFVALSDSLGVRRGVRARLADGSEWIRLLDLGWVMERMREPWRLVPFGPLAILVGDAGELSAIVVRGDTEVRLEPGATLAEYAPDRGTQLMLRQARVTVGADLVQGILLDAQLGRALHSTAARDPVFDAELDDADDAIAANGDATPAARPGTEALLMDNAGYYLVLAAAAAGQIGWIHWEGRDEVLRGAQLRAVAWEADEDGTRVPTAWEIVGPGDLAGELTAEVGDGVDVTGAADVERIGYAIVSGWVTLRSVRRDVFGVIRHVR